MLEIRLGKDLQKLEDPFPHLVQPLFLPGGDLDEIVDPEFVEHG